MSSRQHPAQRRAKGGGSKSATAKAEPRQPSKSSPSARAERRPDLKVVTEPSRLSFGAVGTIAFFVIFGGLLALAAFHSVIVRNQVELDNLGNELEQAREQQRVLQLEVADLESPVRILAEAQSRLGMVEPPDRVYLDAVRPGSGENPVLPPGVDPFGRSQP